MKPGKIKKWKAKLFRCTRGAISILLCLVMAPFLTISLGLVEYARYQQVYELVDELEELTGISLLNDYDPYIHNRFGLFAVSQRQNMNSVATEFMRANLGSLGSQTTLNSVSVKGLLNLNDTDVMKNQIIDVAELTGLGQVLMEDFNLQEVFSALGKLKQLDQMFDMVNGVAELTTAISNTVTTMETLQDTLISIQNAANNIQSAGKTLATQIDDFFTKLINEGYSFPSTLTGEEWDEILLSITGDYEEDLKAIFGTANNMISYADTIERGVEAIPKLMETLEGNVEACTKALEAIQDSSGTETGAIANEAGSTLEKVVEEMEKLVEDTLTGLKDSTIKTVKDAANQIVETTFDQIGLLDAMRRYSAITRGDYFETDVGKQDVKDLVSLIPEVYNSGSPDAMLDALKAKLIPNIQFSVDDWLKAIKGVLTTAVNAITSSTDEGFFSMITKLVNTLQNLFKLTVFYDPSLNANLSNNPVEKDKHVDVYMNFINSLKDMSEKTTEIGNLVKNVSLKNLLTIVKKLGEFVIFFGSFITSLGQMIGDTLGSLFDLISGGVDAAYEKMLVAGYAAHNFPNRTDALRATEYTYNKAGSTKRVALSGTGITGFDYNQIARPYSYVAQSGGLTVQQAVESDAGRDNMFKGALMEFILAPTTSEAGNQTIVFMKLYFLRLLCNLTAVFMDGEVASLAGAANVACWLVYIIYALIEPFCDTLLLVNGGSVPLIKFDCFMTGTGLKDFLEQLGKTCMAPELYNSVSGTLNGGKPTTSGNPKPDGSSGMSGLSNKLMSTDYGTHLFLMAMIGVDSTSMVNRIKGLVKLETAEYYRQKNIAFDWNKTYTEIAVTADVDFYPFFDVGALSGSGSTKINSERVQPVGY